MTTDYKKYLLPEVISKLANMELRARFVVEGFITGLHRSPFHGFSVEFAEHRQYMPGDEIKYIDWKILARTDKYFIKEFEEETNLKCYILLDKSKSMNYSSGKNITKLEYAKYVAASLSYLMIQQKDAAGLITFDETLNTYIPPHATHSYLKQILKELQNLNPGNKTGTAKSLSAIAERIKRRGLIIVLSDLFDNQSDVISTLKHFRYNNHEVIVFQILDPLERSFAFGKDAIFKDMETDEEMTTQPHQIQKAYQMEMKKFIDTYKKECMANHIDYNLIDTSVPFDTVLFNYLKKRIRIH
jgi:uncharacterized protein (DUF58 family)